MPKKKAKKTRSRKKDFEQFSEEVEHEIETDLVKPIEKRLPKRIRKEIDKDFMIPLKKRHLLGSVIIILVAAIFALAIIGIDTATPGTMNPFVPPVEDKRPEQPEPEPITEKNKTEAPVAEPETETYFPTCEDKYRGVDITANEITNIGACLRERGQYHTCIVWGLRNARK